MVNILKDKVILVTGGTGSMGTEIVRTALGSGTKKVIVYSRDEIKHFMLRRRISDSRLESAIGDVRDCATLEKIFVHNHLDMICHAAAMKHVVMCEEAPLEAAETNVRGTQNITDLALKYGVPKLITISTDKAAYPVNVMGATKLIAERITLNASKLAAPGQSFACVRYGNVAISRGSVIPVFIDSLIRHKPILVTDPEVTRFAMETQDAVKLVLKATEYARGGEIFILKMRAFRLGDVVDVIVKRIAPKLKIPPKDVKVEITGLLKGEKLDEDLINRLEAQHLYTIGDMFVILEGKTETNRRHFKKVELKEYTSRSTPRISKDEIEDIIVRYLREYMVLGELKYGNGLNP